jgi:hypothetical protein
MKRFTGGRVVSPEKQRRPYGPACDKRYAEDEQKGFGPRQLPIASHMRLNCWTVSEFAREAIKRLWNSPHPFG